MLRGQYERLKLLRPTFFSLIKEHPEDVSQRFDLLVALTENGKKLKGFEEQVSNCAHFMVIIKLNLLFLNIVRFNGTTSSYINFFLHSSRRFKILNNFHEIPFKIPRYMFNNN